MKSFVLNIYNLESEKYNFDIHMKYNLYIFLNDHRSLEILTKRSKFLRYHYPLYVNFFTHICVRLTGLCIYVSLKYSIAKSLLNPHA